MKFLLNVFVLGFLLLFHERSGANPPAFAQFQHAAEPVMLEEGVFTDIAGKEYQIADFKGKVVLLVFWATWCGPCVSEASALDGLSRKFADRPFKLLALSQDVNPETVKLFLQQKKLHHTEMFFDTKGLNNKYNIRGIPTAILINHKGEEVGRQQGAAPWDSAAATALIEYYLKKIATDKPDSPVETTEKLPVEKVEIESLTSTSKA